MKLSYSSSVPVDELRLAKHVLFLGPSLGTSTQLWDRARQELENDYTVVAWDLPGHGEGQSANLPITISSLAKDVVGLAYELGVLQFSYAGVSIGGAIGLEIARLFPELLLADVIICSAAKIGEPDVWVERAAQVRAQGVQSLLESTPSRWFTQEFITNNHSTVDELLHTLSQVKSEDYAKLCDALSSFDVRELISKIRVPMLIISGEEDPVTPPAAGALISESVLNGRQVIVPGASHLAVVEKPHLVAKEISAFLSAVN